MSEAPGVLFAQNIRVHFAGVHALDGVDLRVSAGEILGLIGPNGAGKTTLLNVVAGMQEPKTGTVALDGKDVTHWSASRRARAGIGRTFQGARLFERLTVFENVEVGATTKGGSRAEVRRRTHELVEFFGLADVAARPAGVLSHGLARRLGVARALSTQPRFMLLDEPAAGLDEEESAELVTLLRAVRDRFELGLVVIEHDVPLIMSLCERIHVLDHGKTLIIGTPDAVSRDPIVMDAYLGQPVGRAHDA
jgi:branched-chain amino acid transport system ATP-binding protein